MHCWICSQEITGLTVVVPLSCSYFGHVVYTHVTGQMSEMLYSCENDCRPGGKLQHLPACRLPTDLVFFDAHTCINYGTTFCCIYYFFHAFYVFLAFVWSSVSNVTYKITDKILLKIFARDVSVDRKVYIKFWKLSTSECGSANCGSANFWHILQHCGNSIFQQFGFFLWKNWSYIPENCCRLFIYGCMLFEVSFIDLCDEW